MYVEVMLGKAVGRGASFLTYFSALPLEPGTIVEVPLMRGRAPAVVYKKVAQPKFKCKEITRILYSKPLPRHLTDVALWMADYYTAPLSSVVSMILPTGVLKKRRGSGAKGKTEQTEQGGGETEQPFGDDGQPVVTGDASLEDRQGQVQAITSSTRSRRPVVTGGASLNCSSLVANGLGSNGAELVLVGPSLVANGLGSNGTELALVGSSLVANGLGSNDTELVPADAELVPLNQAQKKALIALQQAPGDTKLLFGVTGSGKTNIYLYEAFRALSGQKSVVLLVPEIALTGQLVQVFRATFGEIVTVIHSKQTEVERQRIFDNLLLSDTPNIVIGPRSALFAPVANLGLIIIDEEHEATYYQESTPKYSAIRVASKMASLLKIPCILGSATPNLEDFYLASSRGTLVTLTQKAKKTAVKPEVQLIDFKNRDDFSRNRYFSNQLLRAIAKNLEQGRQTLIFHNRRGSSPLTICENCGEELLCPNCFLPLTLHADSYEMRCHTCDYRTKVPSCCPKCGNAGLIHKGFGTKLLENELKRLFPKARVRRYDADSKKGESLDETYASVRDGEVEILVGTQVLAKGLDLPLLSTVGVVQADAGLSLPDFSAEERTFQLITQVMGRVGRGHLEKAEVFIQTFQPEHPALLFAMNEDYLGFSEYLLKKRRKSGFPPFMFVAKVTVTMKTEATTLRKIREAMRKLSADTRLIVSPPMPAFHERTARGFTWEIVVRSRSRQALIAAFLGLDNNFYISLDPPSLL